MRAVQQYADIEHWYSKQDYLGLEHHRNSGEHCAITPMRYKVDMQ